MIDDLDGMAVFVALVEAKGFRIVGGDPVDIVAEGYDAGVRLGEMIDQDMHVVAASGEQRLVVVGAPRAPRLPAPHAAELAPEEYPLGELANPGLTGWENFYVIVGSSGAALIELQFVVIALIAETRTTCAKRSCIATPSSGVSRVAAARKSARSHCADAYNRQS